MANKGKGKGKTPFWQRRRVTLTTGLASARDFARSTRSYTAFVHDWSSSDPGPPPMIANSSSSSSSSGYEAPHVGWIGVLYVLQYFQVQMSHFSLNALRTLRNMLVPTPQSMTNDARAYSGQSLSDTEVMPQQTIALNVDLAAASRRHAPGRWAYSAETTAILRNNAPPKGKNKGHSKGKQFLGNPNSSSGAASAALPRREVVDTIVGNFTPPTPSTEVLGHGPYWISHIRYIQLSDERTVADTGPLAIITHDIGQCPSTH